MATIPAGSGLPPEERHPSADVPMPKPERMMQWFKYDHLPAHLQTTSKAFFALAAAIALEVQPGPERTVALRKLLEAKDAAVRATLVPGG